MSDINKRTTLYEIKKNTIWGIIIDFICVLLIIRIAFSFNENPLGATISISFLLLVILLQTDSKTLVYEDRIVFLKKRTLPFLSTKYVVLFKDVSKLEIEKAGIIHPGFLLPTSTIISQRNASLIIHFKNGTFKKVILWGRTEKYYKMLELALERINK